MATRHAAVAVIGAGRVGSAIARAARAAGMRVAAIVAEHRASAIRLAREMRAPDAATTLARLPDDPTVIAIAVPDDRIARVVARLATDARAHLRGVLVVHTAGALGREVLRPLAQRGARTIAAHPAYPFRTRSVRARDLRGIGWGIECDGCDWPAARALIRAWGGTPVRTRSGHRTRYHAACAIAGNYVPMLLYAAEREMRRAGIGAADTPRLLMPLVDAALAAFRQTSGTHLTRRLTGPVARADARTLAAHLRALGTDRAVLHLYRQLAASTLELLVREGALSPAAARKLHAALRAPRR